MLKDRTVLEAIEIREDWDATEASLRQAPALFTNKHLLKPIARRQQVAHIVGGVSQLLITELINPAPVTALGLLIEVNTY